MQRFGSWAALGLLLAATLAGALSFDRRSWPGLVGDEATYLMQAQSLAWDLDLRYSRRDYDRFVEQWGTRPDGLILQSGDGGRTLVYAKPASYAVWVAPFLRLSPLRGAAIANALLLALAAVLAARTLERRLGPAAPLWVAVWIFASVTFAYVFWAHSDLFLMSLVAIALALAYGGPREDAMETPLRFALRWAGAGVLLGLVLASRPFYGALLLPAALAVPPAPAARRRAGIAILAAGAAVAVLASGLGHLAEADSWTPYSGQRQSFDAATGFPEVDLAAGSWRQRTAGRGNRSWLPSDMVGPRLTAWNGLYFLAGRDVGILPYFLPLLLGLAAFRRGEGRGLLLLAALAAAACFLLTRPFNFYGGGGAIANRYFLPIYPAFWFAAGRPARAWTMTIWAVVATLLAAPFLLPLWRHPRAFFLDADNGYRFVSAAARRGLPFETTQSHLKPSGGEDFVHNGLWIKALSTSVRPDAGGGTLRLGPEGRGELLLGSSRPLPGLRMIVLPPGPASGIEVAGAQVTMSRPRLRGGSVLLLHFERPRAVHKMWWSEDENPFYLYEIRLEAPAGFAFQLHPLAGAPGTVGTEGG
ncbi:MAG TPA: hypothetical protein VGH73_00655 [Thermoanaerobaculia bacterium]|jgi:hypothetical protein